MEYISVEEVAQKWGISIRSVQLHCQKGNVVGAILRGRTWVIPVSAARPKRKYNHTPFVIAENLRQFYYKGLAEWRKGAQVRLRDTCGTGQDVFKALLTKFGYSWLVKGAEL